MTKSLEQEHPKKAFGWAARDSLGVLSPFKFSRRYRFSFVMQYNHLITKLFLYD
jgi:hypothetical protein